MVLVNALLNRTFDLLLSPMRPLPPLVILSTVSLLTAVAILIVVRSTSNQQALAAVKRQIQADLFEMRLFNDDLRAMLRAQGAILRHNATYLRLSFAPMLWLSVPLILAIAQLESYFGHSGVAVGQSVLITAQLKSLEGAQTDTPRAIVAEAGAGASPLERTPNIRFESPAISIPALRQVLWRVAPEAPGDYTLRLQVGHESYDKSLHASDGLARRSPVRPSRGVFDQLRYPSEAPLPDSALVASISVSYPERYMNVLGWQVPWVAVYLVESMVFALALKTPLRVVF